MGLLRIGNSLQMNKPSAKGKMLLLANCKLPLNILSQFPYLKDGVIYIPPFKCEANTRTLTRRL